MQLDAQDGTAEIGPAQGVQKGVTGGDGAVEMVEGVEGIDGVEDTAEESEDGNEATEEDEDNEGSTGETAEESEECIDDGEETTDDGDESTDEKTGGTIVDDTPHPLSVTHSQTEPMDCRTLMAPSPHPATTQLTAASWIIADEAHWQA